MSGKEKSITVKIERVEVYEKISFQGNLVYNSIETVGNAFDKLDLSLYEGFILNMSDVNYIDSTGFGMFINFTKKLHARNKKVVAIVTDEFIEELFDISQMNLIIPIVKTEEEAKQLLKSKISTLKTIEEYFKR